MALEKQDLLVIKQFRQKFIEGKSLAILGDCDFLFNLNDLNEFAINPITTISSPSITLNTFASAFGFTKVDSFDISGNPTVKIDLQSPIPQNLKQQYDWIIDAGTLFWCADVMAVCKNLLSIVKVNGCILHISGLTGYFGRGYYSIHPKLFFDFYNQNGGHINHMGLRVRPVKQKVSLLDCLIRKVWKKSTQQAWKLFSNNAVYLKKVTKYEIEFSELLQDYEPSFIPNNAVVLCFVQIVKKTPFRLPFTISY